MYRSKLAASTSEPVRACTCCVDHFGHGKWVAFEWVFGSGLWKGLRDYKSIGKEKAALVLNILTSTLSFILFHWKEVIALELGISRESLVMGGVTGVTSIYTLQIAEGVLSAAGKQGCHSHKRKVHNAR
jgi:hypothetical protein